LHRHDAVGGIPGLVQDFKLRVGVCVFHRRARLPAREHVAQLTEGQGLECNALLWARARHTMG
jgi:hypothetical protein